MRRFVAALAAFAILACATPLWAAPGPTWRLAASGHDVFLTDVPADSDDVGTTFTCAVGEKAARADLPDQAHPPAHPYDLGAMADLYGQLQILPEPSAPPDD